MSHCAEAPENGAVLLADNTARIALIGNPNCGKTALFNALTGSRQHVANYPGVTVERKAGNFTTPGGRAIRVLDLPGTYSLRARSPDEVIARDVVLGRVASEALPEFLLCVADATDLRLSLRLALELKALGAPMALVLNMADIAKNRGIVIDTEKLAGMLGMPVIASVAVRKAGIRELLAFLDERVALGLPAPKPVPAWEAPDRHAMRDLQRQADALIAACVTMPAQTYSTTARIDKVLLHPIAGLVVLFAILFVMFQAVFTWAQAPMDAISNLFDWLGVLAGHVLPAGPLLSFLRDGVLNGVGSVVVFLPQILILFFFILVLEDFGYMARAAFLMDRIMGGAGLHGRAFIPLLSSFACAIPGIMATRVIDGRRDRLATILVAPLMTCSARIPVYTLIIGAFIPDRHVLGIQLQGLVMFGLYAVGIVAALGVSFIMKRLVWRKAQHDPFLLQLPDYKMPSPRSVAIGLWQRAKAFLKRAGTTIFSMMIVIWALCSLPLAPKGATQPAIDYSAAAWIGHVLAPIFQPIGFNWQINVALIPGMAAREVAVAALGTVYSISASADNPGHLGGVLAAHWSIATALALLAWYVFSPQCASTLATIRRETGGWQWAALVFAYMLALAYGAAFVTYQLACLAGLG
ncbi:MULTISPECIES: ferrous iron transporter B [unclassified Acidocella]|uniref:ferrous iron transporter B n=1 Tax=unclassified Acidocella TaxID=2648610 RepID=UPI00028C642D|nr:MULTISPECIES: ferrous iron transporter B [unclassified Acidocella]EKM98985.1 ferrous iron transport protein B [Acidocella sp. MX-AZ02]WBO58580.1 ferrous iron transporter B [Acidocella sp. MX-AZ03]